MYLQAMQCQCRGRQSHHRRYGVPSAPPADTSSGRKSVSLPERFHTASFIRSAGYDRVFASSVSAESEGCYKDDPYKHLLVQTLTDRLAEAATEKMHEYVRKTVWGYAPDESLSIPDLLVEKYQGIRPAVGYPSLPDQSVNFILDELLDMKQIGIMLTENGAMYPHASVCGLMFSHPQSRYFAVGKIGEDQLEDYACRRGKPIEEMRKFLAANLKS